MPTDAKLGLVVGVGLVVAVALLFFRKETSDGAQTATAPAAVAESVKPKTSSTTAGSAGSAGSVTRPPAARPASWTKK